MEVYAVVEATREVHVTLVVMVTVALPQDAGMGHIAAAVTNPEASIFNMPPQDFLQLTTPDIQVHIYPGRQASSWQIVLSDSESTK